MVAPGWPTTSASEVRLSSRPLRRLWLSMLLAALGVRVVSGPVASQGNAQAVTGTIAVSAGPQSPVDRSGVVVWLTPADEATSAAQPTAQPRSRAKILQRGKRFLPGVLVVRTGSVVDFPNLDPIFHNVFSLFEGKRFDLGLYEAGSSRSVTLSVAGVNYIFCNIHPEMSAVVVAVDTDHHATSVAAGGFSIANVPPGRYRLYVWHDRFKPEQASDFPRTVTVPAAGLSLGTLTLVDSGRVLTPHKNKFGHDYVPPDAAAPIYR